MLTRAAKKKIITKHQTHKSDTGSPHVQIAILTEEINLLASHLQEHPKDESARRGLLAKVALRRKLLNSVKLQAPEAYAEIVEKNKLKK